MAEDIYSKRIEYAHRYFEFLNCHRTRSWVEKLEVLNAENTLGLPEALVLLNPVYFSEIEASDQRGKDSFQPAKPGSKCRSRELWGYECPFSESTIHVDHSFPRSRGGMTHSDNAMYLCQEHNLPKSNDIHLIPWERMLERRAWIDISFNHLIASAASTTRV